MEIREELSSCMACEEVTLALGHFPTPYECKLTGESDWLDKPKRFIDNCPKGFGDVLKV